MKGLEEDELEALRRNEPKRLSADVFGELGEANAESNPCFMPLPDESSIGGCVFEINVQDDSVTVA